MSRGARRASCENVGRMITPIQGGHVSQDTYWCHAVRSITAFSPNRIGEYDSHYRTHRRIYYRTYCRAILLQ